MGTRPVHGERDRFLAHLPRWFWFSLFGWEVVAPVSVTIWSAVHILQASGLWAGITDPHLWIVNGVVWAISVFLLFATAANIACMERGENK